MADVIRSLIKERDHYRGQAEKAVAENEKLRAENQRLRATANLLARHDKALPIADADHDGQGS